MNLDDISIVFLLCRASIIFFVLLLITRIVGRKQMGQLTFFNYITGITIGSISADIVTNTNKYCLKEVIILIWWCILTMITGYLALKFMTIRKIAEGRPLIVINKGKIDEKSLRAKRLNISELLMLLRNQSVFSISEVEYAIFEANGNLSILKKQNNKDVEENDVKTSLKKLNSLPLEIIVDGKIAKNNLKKLNLNEQWITEHLKKQGINSIEEVFYAQIENDGELFIQKSGE